jgi:hypothetical protein
MLEIRDQNVQLYTGLDYGTDDVILRAFRTGTQNKAYIQSASTPPSGFVNMSGITFNTWRDGSFDPSIYMLVSDGDALSTTVEIGEDIQFTGNIFGARRSHFSINDMQLKIQDAYTPSNSSDGTWDNGTITVDDNYIYYKTSSGTWKRIAWTTF